MTLRIEYLVKPYQDSTNLPIDGCAAMEVPPFAHNPFVGVLEELDYRGITPDEYLDMLLSLWKERIDGVAEDASSLFVTVDIFPNDDARPGRLRELRSYAEKQLEERFLSAQSGYDVAYHLHERGQLDGTIHINAYGEISDRCCWGETRELARNIFVHSPDAIVLSTLLYELCPDRVEGKFDF